MTKTNWLVGTCAIALLCAGSASAQAQAVNPGGGINHAPSAQDSKDTMDKAPPKQADKDRMDRGADHAAGKPMHTSRSSRTDTSQDAAVDQLNDRSLQSAQQGKAFSADNSDTPSGKKM
jgi:hypothetical protein